MMLISTSQATPPPPPLPQGGIICFTHLKKINVVYVNSPIMNQLSYHVDDKKIKKKGLILKSNIEVDIKDTLLLFKHLKNEM